MKAIWDEELQNRYEVHQKQFDRKPGVSPGVLIWMIAGTYGFALGFILALLIF